MPREIRVAFFGNGFTRTTILPCLAGLDGLRLVGLASPNQERARATAEAFGIEHVSDDHREILAAARPDLVFVVTPPDRHHEQALDALRLGCHVVSEKPTALHGGESAAMWAEALRQSAQLSWIDHELRFDPRRRLLARWIREGRIGQPLHASYRIHSSSRRNAAAPWTWWSDADRGGGALGALGSHGVDALRSVLGEIDEARGTLHTFIKSRPLPEDGTQRGVTADDFASALLRFRSGALGTLEVSVVEGERLHEFRVSGTEGAVRWVEQGPLLAAFGRDRALEEVLTPDDLPPNSTLGIPDTDWARCFLRMSRELVAALGGGPVPPDAATFEDGHRNQLVLDAIRSSHETAEWVAVRAPRSTP